jgi:trehalose 6-phosphate phosphatase
VRPDGTIEQTTKEALPANLVGELAREVRAAVPGALVEEKGSSLALHWRARPGDAAALLSVAERLAAEHRLRRSEGRNSVELFDAGAPDKSFPVRELGAGMGCVAFAGDDRGDLAAFDALDGLAERGAATFRIAVDSDEVPSELLERADLVCAGPAGLVRLIEELAG